MAVYKDAFWRHRDRSNEVMDTKNDARFGKYGSK